MRQTQAIARQFLRASTALSALVLIEAGMFASPAFAQDQGTQSTSTEAQNEDQSTAGAPEAGTQAPAVPVQNANEGAEGEEIVVTGTLFRRTNTETPSPVTVLSSESLARRGITNVSDAVRSISADSSGSIPNAFTGGFGAGASAPSLRGLTVNSTLTVVDGLRMVTYPLSDDGQRAFVDLNTIPRVAIERIEVLKDGASSTYGADAIGGVVNVILRKQYNGIEGTVEAGTSEHGDGNQYRGSILAGWGDYESRGLNFYLGAEYERNKKIYARDRGFPFNTQDLSSIEGGLNLNRNLLGLGGTGTPAIVLPSTQLVAGDNLSGVVTGSVFQLLNPAQCTNMGGTLTFDEETGSEGCEQDQTALWGEIQPETIRFGFVARGSVRLSDVTEAYVTASWYRSTVKAGFEPQTLRVSNPLNTLNFVLPNYVCDDGIDCINDPTRRLNPYNPYASEQGDPLENAARLYYRFAEFDNEGITKSDVLRAAVGVNGTIGDAWNWSVDAAAVLNKLRIIATTGVSLRNFTTLINQGRYNLLNPEQNSQEIRDFINLGVDSTSNAGLYLVQGVLTRELFQLPGGPLNLGVGAHFRHESLDNPNVNPTQDLIGQNEANAKGNRDVSAAFFEISAPVVRQLEFQLSGRYDHYSTGFSAFSPKAGFKFTPIRQIALRGTWSKGFRAPSFAETSGQITGFIGFNPSNFESVCVEHGGTFDPNEGCEGQSPYAGPGALGLRSDSNPDLDPERSRSYTLGSILQPLPWLSFTVDYYNIKKKDIITAGPNSNAAISAYYNGTPLPDGYSVILNSPDPLFPNAIRTILIVNGPYENASVLRTSGLDFSALAQIRLSPNVRFSSNLEATKILKYKFQNNPGDEVQEYVGTQGPYIISSGAGTPKWRGNWSNSIEFGPATLTATAYYVSGYKNIAEDVSGAGARHDCAAAGDLYNDETLCKTKSFTYVDLVGSYEFNERFTAYFNVLNLFDAKAPLNPPNYAAANYNPTYTQQGAVGRFFRFGANFKFGGSRAPVVAPAPAVLPPPPPPEPAPAPATQTCPDGSVTLATESCPVPPPPPPPPAPEPERG